jgi:hypothetical protein
MEASGDNTPDEFTWDHPDYNMTKVAEELTKNLADYVEAEDAEKCRIEAENAAQLVLKKAEATRIRLENTRINAENKAIRESKAAAKAEENADIKDRQMRQVEYFLASLPGLRGPSKHTTPIPHSAICPPRDRAPEYRPMFERLCQPHNVPVGFTEVTGSALHGIETMGGYIREEYFIVAERLGFARIYIANGLLYLQCEKGHVSCAYKPIDKFRADTVLRGCQVCELESLSIAKYIGSPQYIKSTSVLMKFTKCDHYTIAYSTDNGIVGTTCNICATFDAIIDTKVIKKPTAKRELKSISSFTNSTKTPFLATFKTHTFYTSAENVKLYQSSNGISWVDMFTKTGYLRFESITNEVQCAYIMDHILGGPALDTLVKDDVNRIIDADLRVKMNAQHTPYHIAYKTIRNKVHGYTLSEQQYTYETRPFQGSNVLYVLIPCSTAKYDDEITMFEIIANVISQTGIAKILLLTKSGRISGAELCKLFYYRGRSGY